MQHRLPLEQSLRFFVVFFLFPSCFNSPMIQQFISKMVSVFSDVSFGLLLQAFYLNLLVIFVNQCALCLSCQNLLYSIHAMLVE